MKMLSIAAALLCILALAACVAPVHHEPMQSSLNTCARHAPIATGGLAAELNNVYVNCEPHFACPVGSRPTAFETKSIDGYGNYSQWLWSGVSTTTFDIAFQDNLIQTGIAAANSSSHKPPGKSVTNIQFFTTFTVPNGQYSYFLGETVTYARCEMIAYPVSRDQKS